MYCNSNKHNFLVSEYYTGGVLYKCSECGLVVDAPSFSGDVFVDFFGSYFNGFSNLWDPQNMRVSEIIGFDFSSGSLPTTFRFDGSKLITENPTNEIHLTNEEITTIKQCLASLDFNSFVTSKELFRKFCDSGFSLGDRLICRFSNGKAFDCLEPNTKDFEKLVSLIKKITNGTTSPTQKEPAKASVIPAIWVSCCKKAVPEFASFCPHCGKKITDKTQKCTINNDSEETTWFCQECGSDNGFGFKFCLNCGQKCPWQA